ncbi:hypothetical protein DTO021C3_3454 [Paecilomyces variotii]|nr:hypothetical protein DTO195F2_344 [Paecilomyces variotii]KAJ9288929.1 hypothetical protein DTO021C3_3454 [Paecilomyces variotii]
MNSTNNTSSTSSQDSDHGGIDHVGMIVSFSIFSFLVLDIIVISLWTCHRFGRPDVLARERLKFKTSSKESRLQKLQKVAPKESFDTWWKTLKSDLHLSSEVDGTYVCAICLDAVSRTQTIHELKCRHVFHDDLGGVRDEGEERSVTDMV